MTALKSLNYQIFHGPIKYHQNAIFVHLWSFLAGYKMSPAPIESPFSEYVHTCVCWKWTRTDLQTICDVIIMLIALPLKIRCSVSSENTFKCENNLRSHTAHPLFQAVKLRHSTGGRRSRRKTLLWLEGPLRLALVSFILKLFGAN